MTCHRAGGSAKAGQRRGKGGARDLRPASWNGYSAHLERTWFGKSGPGPVIGHPKQRHHVSLQCSTAVHSPTGYRKGWCVWVFVHVTFLNT